MVEFDQVTTIFIAIALLLLGTFLVNKFSVLNKYSIPAPVVGGLLAALIIFILNEFNIVSIGFDTSLQTLFMLVFFTTVGLGASMKLIKTGGKLLLIYWLFAGILSLIQNTSSVLLSKLLNVDPLIGLMSGSISMIGGHGGAAAFGETIEGLGVEGALTAGVAAATFGLVAGSVLGGPVSRFLINRNNLSFQAAEQRKEEVELVVEEESDYSSEQFIIQLAIITFSMALGSFLGTKFSDLTGVILPNYVSAMFVAVLLRSLLDTEGVQKRVKFDYQINDLIGSISLGIFLSMALMSIKLWEIIDLALPLLVIGIFQVVFIVLFTVFIVFRFVGKDYDAAVMMSGMVGHGLGATPTAMANMDAVTKNYGPSKTAFLIVPIVGAFLVDVVNVPIVLFFINLLAN